MSESNCYISLKAYVKKNDVPVNDTRLRAFAEEMDTLTKSGLSKAKIRERLEEFTKGSLQAAAQNQRTEQLMNLAKRTSITKELEANIEHLGIYKAVEAWIDGGSFKPGTGTNLDVKHIRAHTQVDLEKGFKGSLGKLKDELRLGAADKETVHALSIIRDGGKFPADMSKEAIAYAKAATATFNKILALKKAMNPYMEGSDEFLFTRAHNREKITAVGADVWVEKAYAAYGEKSFPGSTPAQKKDFFRNVYARIEDGTFGGVFDREESNRLFKMSRGRTFVANNWEAEFNYMKEFGEDTLFDSIMTTISRSSADIARLEKFTGKPNTFINKTIKGLEQKIELSLQDPNISPEKAKKLRTELDEFKNNKKNLRKSISTAIGESDSPARGAWARRVEGVATLEYVTSLGMATVASTSDVINAATIVRGLNGKNVFVNAASMVGPYLKYFFASDAAKIKTAEKLHIVLESVQNNMLRELGGATKQPGLLGKAIELFGVLNLLQRHVEGAKLSTGELVSNILADRAHLPFEKLPDFFQQGLGRYSAGPHEWEFYRLGMEDWTRDAKSTYSLKMLSADSLDAIPDEFVIKYMRQIGAIAKDKLPVQEMIDRYRFGLGAKLSVLINDHAAYGSTTPGTHQKAFLHRGFDINTPEGAALRLTTQFKSTSFMQYDTARRALHSGTGPRGDWAGVAQMAAGLIFVATMKEMVREALDGKTPSSPVDPKFQLKVALNSGVGGVLGEVLSSAAFAPDITGKMKGMGTSILGPVGSDVLEGIAIGAQYIQAGADPKSKAPHYQASKFAQQLVPGNNLWFTKAAMNFYIFNGLRDWADIDTSRIDQNKEQKVNETPGLLDNHQKYFMFRPTDRP